MINLTIYQFKCGKVVIAFIFLYMFITWMTNSLIFTDEYYYNFFSNQFSRDKIEKIIAISNRFKWIGYAIMPVILISKWTILAFSLYVVLFLKSNVFSYINCFKIILLSEIVMIFASLVKLLLLIFHTSKSIEEIQFISSFSLVQLFSIKQIPNYLVYPLQVFNLFEILYWILIAAGIQAFSKKTFWESLKITASSYGVVMFIWILFIVFIQLQFS